MKNELKDICDKLEGYSASGIPDWEVVEAVQFGSGAWRLVVKKPETTWVKVKEEDNADK